MDIKRIVKYSFISMAVIIFIITAINTVVIYQIKENNNTKQSINDLVSMQEKMNELLKDTTTVKSIEELEQKKKDFIKYELEFEEIEKRFILKDENDLVDFFISDIHENEIISTKLKPFYPIKPPRYLIFLLIPVHGILLALGLVIPIRYCRIH